jgi:hypothetical protein
MVSNHLLRRFSNRQISMDLAFTIQLIHREFTFLPDKSIEKIEEHLIEFYVNNQSSKVKPKTLGAVLVQYYGSRTFSLTMNKICKTFNVNMTWFRKCRRIYLSQLGLTKISDKICDLNLNSKIDWRFHSPLQLFTSSGLADNNHQGQILSYKKLKIVKKKG